MTDLGPSPPGQPQPDVVPQPPAPPQPWGYVPTLGFALMAFIAGTIVAVVALVAMTPGALQPGFDIGGLMKDARAIAVTTIATNITVVGLIVALSYKTGWQAADYLALTWPPRREVAVALASLAVALPLLDGLAYVAGQPIVPDFQTDLYRSAQSTGAMLLLWIAIVVAAPVAEEIVFRGFIFRGWVRSSRAAIPAILALTALFAVIHVQYNWFGIFQVFCLGLLLAWIRWRSGSTLMPMALHVIANLYAMIQTVAVIHWLS